MYNVELIKRMVYDKSKDEVLQLLDEVCNAELLHIFAYNYNWDDGFEIPKRIILNNKCELSTALMIFYLSGGEDFLLNQQEFTCNNSIDYMDFLQGLYRRIIDRDFVEGNILFEPPLNKVKMYKLKKVLTAEELIFIQYMGELNCNVSI
ncbi:MAG: DUF4274 domain-containing protein [Clostridia bacterium]|nr:DUF4274 domain-containing protein [Clostridia bacterium]